MIDPYLIQDKKEPDKWWCFYKQKGASISYSYDLKNWTYYGQIDAGENVCVFIKDDEYILLHSPSNGIGFKKSKNLENWEDTGKTTLDQNEWSWAQGRITAGFVWDCRGIEEIEKNYLMFFHGTPEDEAITFDTYASIGLAWSNDFKSWDWPR